uniref:UDP-glucose/GDP-mannose dehydrogenase C-terminal domain-containing protein n=1 Tax=Timspurckia oligopyrenoides TaxID=708627 RepID=A0A6T6M4P7_9RHOD|mmetsp:Transcript_2158/g.3801  ORF Transcript_2158/g.3801 Transcript_2158/m.3801 type:complete len:457 (+) Transcript_2158:157-1527(+)
MAAIEIYNELQRKIDDYDAVIGVFGLGYVGLPLCVALFQSGFKVVGLDVDHRKIEMLNEGVSYIQHIPKKSWIALRDSDRFTATSDIDKLDSFNIDSYIICLPTPVGPHNEPDMQYVFRAVERISDVLRPGTLVILESTTYPGTTEEDVVRILARTDRTDVNRPQELELGTDFFVAFSPEREDPGNVDFTTQSIPKLVGGACEKSGLLASLLYKRANFEQPVLVRSARVAECAKLVENIYRSVNIALVNELKVVFDAMDVDIWDVLDAAETKPFGFQRFNPGPGIGGHCIPVDPFYLAWKAREYGVQTDFIELAARVNARMPSYVVKRLQRAFNDKCQRAVHGARILLLGIAFKPDVDDIRESPALVIWEELAALGATVNFYDPHIPELPPTRKHAHFAGQKSIAWTQEEIHQHDSIIVITHHRAVDLETLKGYPGIVIDSRNAVSPHLGLNVYKA